MRVENAGRVAPWVLVLYATTIQNAFNKAAAPFNPATGIPSPTCEIASDGYDTDQWNARNKQEALGEGLRMWSNFLQQVMIRRTHRDLIWGMPLLELPEGEIKVICVRFCDTEEEVHGKYQEVVRELDHVLVAGIPLVCIIAIRCNFTSG